MPDVAPVDVAAAKLTTPSTLEGYIPGAPKRHPLTPNPQQPVKPEGPAVRMRRSEFVRDINTRPATTPDNRSRREGVMPKEYVDWTPEFVDGMRGFAEGYVRNLIDIRTKPYRNTNETLYDAMKRMQGNMGIRYLEDDYMLGLFAKYDAQSDRYVLSTPEEMKAAISGHPEIIKNLMLIADNYMTDALAAAGLRAQIRQPGHRSNIDRLTRTIDFRPGQGGLNFVARRVRDFLTEPMNERGRGAPGAPRWTAIAITSGAGALVGGPFGAGAAGALLGPPVAAILHRLGRNGPILDLISDPEVLARAQRPGERVRNEDFIGINPRDLIHSRRLEDALQEAIGIAYLRMEYMRALEIPETRWDALTSQFLYVENQRPEETDRTSFDLDQEFERLGGRRANRTLAQQREILRRAKQNILLRNFEEKTRKDTSARVDPVVRINQAITAGAEGGTLVQERTRAATEEKTRLGDDKTSLQGNETTLTNYRNKLQEVETTRRNLQHTISQIARPGVAAPATVQEAINVLREIYNDPGLAIGAETMIPNENGRLVPIPAIAHRREDLDIAKAADRAAVVPNAGETPEAFKVRQREEFSDIDSRYESRLRTLTQQREFVEATITRLEDLETRITTLSNEVTTGPEGTQGTQALADFDEAVNRLGGVNPALDAFLFAGDLSGAMTEINAAGIWPASDNKETANRLLVRRAIAQIRADNEMHDAANIPNFAIFEISYNAIAAPGAQRITPEQLRAMTLQQLEDRADALGIPAGAARTTNLTQAKQWAEYQLEYIQRALSEEIRRVQVAEETQASAVRSVDLTQRNEQLNMVKKILEARDDILKKAEQSFEEQERLREVALAVAGTDGYTNAEETSALPRNVLELLNILTGYQQSADREGDFQKIWRNLGANPDLFRGFLNRAFRELPNANDMNAFAASLSDAIPTRVINPATIGRAFNDKRTGLISQFDRWSTGL